MPGEGSFLLSSIDLRTLWPYDWEMISQSVAKTKRVIFLNEDTEVTNFGEHLYPAGTLFA